MRSNSKVYAVATWSDEFGTTYEWPQGTVDNRRARVLARIQRFGMACDPSTLVITTTKEEV